jgi:hypothetical protein
MYITIVYICCVLAIPLLASVFYRRRLSPYEFVARDIISDADRREESDDEFGDDVDDETRRIADVFEADDAGGTPVLKVRPHLATRFQVKMAYWLKNEFPGGVRSRTVADDEVMRIALVKHMRSLHIRNKDIVLHTPRILTLAYLPTRADIIENGVQRTEAFNRRLLEASTARLKPTLWEWITGTQQPGLRHIR